MSYLMTGFPGFIGKRLTSHLLANDKKARVVALVQGSLRFKPVRKLFSNTPAQSIAYLNHPVTFDTRRAVDLLAPHGLRPPPFNSYVGAMVDYFKANEHDPAHAPADV